MEEGPRRRKELRGQDRRPRHAAGLAPWSARRLGRHAGWGPACRCLAHRLGRSGLSPCFDAASTLELASWPALTTSASASGRARQRRVAPAAIGAPSASSARWLRASQTSSAGAGRPLSRQRARGAEKGRGYVAARLVGSRLGPAFRAAWSSRRGWLCSPWRGPGRRRPHLRYIQRDSVTPEGQAGPRLLGRPGRSRRRRVRGARTWRSP